MPVTPVQCDEELVYTFENCIIAKTKTVQCNLDCRFFFESRQLVDCFVSLQDKPILALVQ